LHNFQIFWNFAPALLHEHFTYGKTSCYNVWLFEKLGPHIVMVHRNLSGYNLTGPISPSFGNLLSLTSLWVTLMSRIVLDYYNLNCFSFFSLLVVCLTLLRFIKTWITLQFQAATFLSKPIECWSCGVNLDRLSCLPPTRFRAFTTF